MVHSSEAPKVPSKSECQHPLATANGSVLSGGVARCDHRCIASFGLSFELASPPAIDFHALSVRSVFAVLLITFCAAISSARPLSEYQRHVQQAVSALDTLAQSDEGETAEARLTRMKETLAAVRSALPANENVEWEDTSFKIDNSWLHRELEKFERGPASEQDGSLTLMTERLQALANRLEEIEKAKTTSGSKAERTKKLGEILQRPEYARGQKDVSALERLWRDLIEVA